MPLQRRLGIFCLRLATMLIVAGVLICLPDPTFSDLLNFKNAGVSFVLVISIGKLLLDTFFYDRFS